MDNLSFLASPVGAAITALVTTLLGELFGFWLDSRKKDTAPPSITVQGRAHVRDIHVGNRWQTVIHHHAPAQRSSTASTPSSNSDADTLALFFIGGWIVMCLSSALLARYWPWFEVGVRSIVVVALFLTAGLWRRWPEGLVAKIGMRALIVTIGSTLLWAVEVIPNAVGPYRDLAFVDRHTRSLGLMDAVGAVPGLLGMTGIVIYSLRLMGLVGLVVLLALYCSKACGVALMATRSDSPRHAWRRRLGARLNGGTPFGWAGFVYGVVMAAFLVALIHPSSLGWIVDHIGVST